MKDKLSGKGEEDQNSFFKYSDNDSVQKKHYLIETNNLEDMHSATDVHQNVLDIQDEASKDLLDQRSDHIIL